jgi:hypothetical protein
MRHGVLLERLRERQDTWKPSGAPQRRDAPVRAEKIVDPKMMREILGDPGRRPYLDTHIFRYREERRAVLNDVVAGRGD